MYSGHRSKSDDKTGGTGANTPTGKSAGGLERTVVTSQAQARARSSGSGSGSGAANTKSKSKKSGGWLSRKVESLSTRFSQNVETRSKNPSFGLRHTGAERVRPAKDLAEYREIPETTPIVRKALTDFASDVVEPGYRIQTSNADVQNYLENDWCPQCAILAGEKHNDLLPFLRQFVYERWRSGDALTEHVRANPSRRDSPITGLHLINPETVEYLTYEEQNVLIDPDAPDSIEVPRTARGEKASYLQYGNQALVSTDRQEVPLSQNDVTRSALDPGPGELRGSPITKTISEDVAGYKNIRRDMEEAIHTKAWGLWDIEFGREVLEYSDMDPETGERIDVTDIVEWSEEDMDDYVTEHLEDIQPGAILAHDGEININRIEGEVPDLIDDLKHYVSNIVSCLPTPLFMVGHEQDINQFITEGQIEGYQQHIREERQELERVFTDLMKRVVEQNLVENSHNGLSVDEVPSDLKFVLEPAESESPVMSLDSDAIERLHMYAEAFDRLRGDTPADMFADREAMLKLILQLPDSAMADLDDDFLDESDPALREAAEQMGLTAEMVDDSDGEADLSPPGLGVGSDD